MLFFNYTTVVRAERYPCYTATTFLTTCGDIRHKPPRMATCCKDGFSVNVFVRVNHVISLILLR